MKRRLLSWKNGLFLVAIVATFIGAALAQTSSRLDGVVKDETGAVIPGATVTLTNVETNATSTTTTSELGVYVFPQVSVGTYRVSADVSGFKKSVVENVKIDVGIPATVNFTMLVGEITQVIEVTASDGQAVVNTVNAELNTLVNRRQILDLPLDGRNPTQLAFLSAGVTNNGLRESQAVNGLRGSYNNLTQDGINIQDNFIRVGGLFAQTAPGVDNVSEFSLTTQNIGADAGFGVAQVKLVTPSGGNEFHGSAYAFHRNTVLDANSFFNNADGLEREKLIRNQFGGRIGGPIFKDKLFFFGHYEGFREVTATSISREVLTEPARRGLFSYRRIDTGELVTINLLQSGAFGTDPFMADLMNLQPLPNSTGIGDGFNTSAFRFNSGDPTTWDRWGFRLDYEMSPAHHFEGVFSQFTFEAPNDTFNDIGEVFPGLPGAGQNSTRRHGSFAWRWNATPVLTNELRWGFQRAPVTFFAPESPQGFEVDFPTANGNFIADNPIRNFRSIGFPQGRVAPTYELLDNASWVTGNHAIRFGGHVRWSRVDSFDDTNIIPLYTLGFQGANPSPIRISDFPGISTSDFDRAQAMAALLGGFLDTASQTFNVTSPTSGFVPETGQRLNLKQNFLAFYGSDTWRLRPNFTLNFGLRWEWHTVPDETNGLGFLPVGGADALFDPNAVFDFAGGNTGRPFFRDDFNNFAPSISFAWDPFGDGRTSIRAGYSISYVIDSNFTAVNNAFAGNTGLQSQVTLGGLTGTISQNQPQVSTPEFMVPRTMAQNIALNPFDGLYVIDSNYRTPYVQQWSLSIEREILRDTAVEFRYVGNRGTKLARALDLNQMIVRENGFVDDVIRARTNMMHCRDGQGNPLPNPANNRSCDPGFEPLALQVFSLLAFRGRPLLNNSAVQNLILQGEAGAIVQTMMQQRSSLFDPRAGARIGPDFFYPNPNAFFADILGNFSWSTYHAFQAEVRRRFSQGLYFQGNYTFSKAFTNVPGNSQSNFDAFLDLQQPTLEKRRPSFDITHVVNANFIYELPLGPGQRFLNFDGVTGKLLQGWQVGGIYNWQTGVPITLISGRSTVNRPIRSDTNTVNTTLTIGQLQEMTGVYFMPADHPAVVAGLFTSGQPVVFDPRLIGADGRASAEFFSNPDAGQVGTLALTPVSGPNFFNVDLSLIKRTPITERTNVEFRVEFFNVFNRTNFAPVVSQDTFGNVIQNINDTSFGALVTTFDPRIIQFALKLNF